MQRIEEWLPGAGGEGEMRSWWKYAKCQLIDEYVLELYVQKCHCHQQDLIVYLKFAKEVDLSSKK